MGRVAGGPHKHTRMLHWKYSRGAVTHHAFAGPPLAFAAAMVWGILDLTVRPVYEGSHLQSSMHSFLMMKTQPGPPLPLPCDYFLKLCWS